MTGVVSDQTKEVDGMLRHVLDLRSAVPPETAPTRVQTFMSDDEDLPRLHERPGSEEESSDSEEEVNRPLPRRSGRENDSLIVTDFDDYDVVIIRGSVVNKCSSGEAMNFV